MSCPGDNYIVPGANPCAGGGGGGAAGVESLNAQTGIVNIVPSNGTIVLTQGGGQIGIEAVLAGNVVTTLNGCVEDVNIVSSDSSVIVTPNTIAKTVNLSAAVKNVNGAVGNVSIVGAGITSVSTAGNVITVGTNADVTSVNGAIGQITLAGDVTGSTTVQTFGGTMSFFTPKATIASVTGSGIATITNTPNALIYNVDVPAPVYPVTDITNSGIAVVTKTGSVFNVEVPAPVYPVPTVTDITGSGSAVVTKSGSVYNVDVTVGGGTSITQGGATVSCDAGGNITLDSATTNTETITMTSKGQLSISSTSAKVQIASLAGGCGFSCDSNGEVQLISGAVVGGTNAIVMNANLTVNSTGEVLTFAQQGGVNAGSIVGLATLNGTDIGSIVTSVGTVSGAVTLSSADASVTITPDPKTNNIDFSVNQVAPIGGVTSLNTLSGALTLQAGINMNVAQSGADTLILSATVPKYEFFRTVDVLSPTLTNGNWIPIATVTVSNDYPNATAFFSGNLNIRYDGSYSITPGVYGYYAIRVVLTGSPTPYVASVSKQCMYFPPGASPVLAYDVLPFTYYKQNFPNTILGPVTFDLEVYLNDMNTATTTFVGVDLSLLIIKAPT